MISLSAESEALARRIAEAQSVPVEVAIRQALEARARAEGVALEPRTLRDQSAEAVAARRARINAIIQGVAALPILDPRPIQDLIDDLNER